MITLKTSNITNTGSALNITASPVCSCCTSINSLCNSECFRLIICTPIPSSSSIVPVNIILNGNTYPLLDCYGNVLMSDQIKCRCAYKLVFGTMKPHFIVRQLTPRSQSAPACVSNNSAAKTTTAKEAIV